MTKENARSKICPFMSTGFAADTDRLRNEGVSGRLQRRKKSQQKQSATDAI